MIYIKIEELDDNTKEANNIKVGAKVPRFDVTGVCGSYKPLEDIKDKDGKIYMYLMNANGIVNNEKRVASHFLQARGSLNFSSIFLVNGENTTGEPLVGYGYGNTSKTYGKDKKTNPFYAYKNDGYLFICKNGTIEILIITGGKYSIEEKAKCLYRGAYNGELKKVREEALPIYNYKKSI